MKPIIITEQQHRIIDQVLRARDEANWHGKRITEAHLGIEQARQFDAGPTGDHQIVIAGIPCRITNHPDFIGYAMEPEPPMRFRFESTNTGKGNWLYDQWMAAQPSQPFDMNIDVHKRILLERIAQQTAEGRGRNTAETWRQHLEKDQSAPEESQPEPACETCSRFHRNPPGAGAPFVCTNPKSPTATPKPTFTCPQHQPL